MIKILSKIRVQILLYYLIIALIAIALIGAVLFVTFSNILIEKSLEAARISTENSGKYIYAYIDKIYDTSSQLANDSKVKDYIVNNAEDQKNNIIRDIQNIMINDEFIKSVIIVTHDGRIISNEDNLTMEMSDDMMEQSWYINATGAMPYLTATRMNEFTMNKDTWVISVSTEILDDNNNNIGVMLIDVDYQFVEQHLFNVDNDKNTEIYIFDSNECLVYYKDTSYFSDSEKKDCLINDMINNEEFDKKTNTATYRYNISNADWTLTSVTILSQLEIMRKKLISDIILVSLGVILLIILLSTIVSKRITNPIKRLEEAMEDNKKQTAIIKSDYKSCDEVRSLTIHYNNMIERINELQEENLHKERMVRESEIAALTSQINPHFLYNTLDTILWMAEYKDTEGVIDMVKALGHFFRLSLSGGASHITIKDEIEHIREYLYIQKKRYGDKLNYSFDLDENIMDVRIPKIILQPIVENAIYHGIKEKDGNGHINIKSVQEDGFIKFIISDDGVGFDTEKLNEPSNRLKLSGVGIKNVDERLKLNYCDNCGVSIKSEKGIGTSVTLKIIK